MSTAFAICITDIYFPHIEDKMLSNVRNSRYHDMNTIKLSLIYLEHHFQIKFSHDRKQMCIFTIQLLVR